MTALTVGAEQQYKTIKDAVAASQDGDTLYVQAGVYVNDFATVNHNISMIGVGGMVQVVTTKTVAKAALIVKADLNIDHFEFSGVKSWNYNGAGLRYEAGNLTVTNSYFHDNQDGILATPIVKGVGSITVRNSEFARNGAGDGQSHNIYVGSIENFTITDSYSHDAVVGHEIKSRAMNTTITNNRIDDGTSNASYSIDVPNGGVTVIANNIIRQGSASQNKIIISYSAETDHPEWTNSSLDIKNNTVVDAIAGKAMFLRNVSSIATANIDGNSFFGLASTELLNGKGVITRASLMTGTAPAMDTSHPWSNGALEHIVSIGIGDDVLAGTAAKDLFVGGAGQDVFIIRPGGGSDTIADFSAGAGVVDVVRFEGTKFASLSDVKAAMSQHGQDVWLNLGKGEVLTFQNHQMADFAADDFVFATSGVTTSSISAPTQVKLFKLAGPAKATTTINGSDTKDDVLTGTSGADSIDGKKGADTMQGGAGDDHYFVDNAKDLVVEKAGAGTDVVISKIASYTLPDNVENLYTSGSISHVAIGNALNNFLVGGGTDSLNGMSGNDILSALAGKCELTGGTGSDIFQFSAPTGGMSTITDFAIGQDLIDLSLAMNKYTGIDPIADHTMSLRSDGHGGTIIAIDPTHTGTMQDAVDVLNVAPTALHMGYDYIF